jgi:HAD superfamily hydrolase (TIGR01509 family)
MSVRGASPFLAIKPQSPHSENRTTIAAVRRALRAGRDLHVTESTNTQSHVDVAAVSRAAGDGPVLFDCDGLLLDTETCWTRAETALFARYGRSYGLAEKEALIGSTFDAAGRIIGRLLDQPDRADSLWDELYALATEELACGADPMPGAVALVAALRGRRPIAVVSNTPRELVLGMLGQAGFADVFDLVICGDDVAEPKPAPDLYLRACALLDGNPADAIALEDSSTGVASARAAGVYVIGIPTLPTSRLDADLLAPSLDHPAVWQALKASQPLGS